MTALIVVLPSSKSCIVVFPTIISEKISIHIMIECFIGNGHCPTQSVNIAKLQLLVVFSVNSGSQCTSMINVRF